MIWYFDSGASRHITSRKNLFCSLDAAPAGKKVTCANIASYPIKGVGKILITISDGSKLCLPNVLYIQGIKKNLLSVSSLAKNGLRVIFEDDRCIVRDRENGYSLITTGTLENGLFMLDRYEKQIQVCLAETKTRAMQDAELWHARFGHVGYGSLMTLQHHNMVHDLSLLEMPPRHVCEGCVLGKMHRFGFSQDGSVRATRKLQFVHSDVCGPMRMPSMGNSLYFVTFIDDFSRFCWVYPLKAKSDVFAIFQHYVSMVENETGCKVQTLRTDRGGEYMSGAFKDFLGKKGIKHQCTMPYTPQQNGVADRTNRSLMEMARCMLKAKSLPHKLWMEAVACATHVLNRCPTRALKTITPYESWYDKKPSVSNLRVFGCLAYAHIPQQLRGKLDDKAVKCIFVGYSSGSKGYRLYNPATNKIFESCDVIFAKTTAQPMVAFDVPHMQTRDVFEGSLPSFVENQESQLVDNFDQSFDQHVTPHDVEKIVREEQEVLREIRTLPKWVKKSLQDSKLDAPLPWKTRAAPAGKNVTCANNASYPIKGVGKILITISDGSNLCSPNVLYVDQEEFVVCTLENGLFVLDCYEKQIQACIAEIKTRAMQDAELWHARFGHVGYGSLMTLQHHNMVHDLSLLEMPPRHVCEGCVLGKIHRFAFSQDGSVRATRKLQLVHSDVCGPMRMPSVGNSLYFVTFIDDFSRFCWVYPLKAKSDVFAIFQHYVSMVENETGCKVQTLCTDRGGEYMSSAFKDFLGKKGIKHQCTMPYTPQQNGVAERKNRSLMEMARCMLKAKSLPHKLWMEAVACAAHVLNRCPTRALKTITPYESWYDKNPSISYLRVFGCLAYAHIPQQLRGKLDDKAVKCIFVGYSSGSKGYRLYNPATNKIFESCDVIFAKTTAQPMVAFDVLHMQTQDVFEGFPSSFCGESRITTAPAGKNVTCANNASYPIKGVGKILITISDGSNLCSPNVLYVDQEEFVVCTLENGLFVLDCYEKQIQACIAEIKTRAMQDAELWHARFGHVGYGSLMTLQHHNMVHDLSLLEMPPRHVCEGCVLGKIHRFAFSQDGSVRATRSCSLYTVMFCWVYPLKAKSDVFAIFQHYVSMVENETGCKVQTLCTDRGGEYMSSAFKDFLGKKGIKHQCTMPYTPQQNGVAERKNRSLMEMARCMLKAKSLPHKLWMEAVACAAHVLNRCPTRALKTITPYESWYDKNPSISYLRVFGCLAYAHIPQQLRGKLDDKAVKCIFVGYSSGSKGYRLYNPATNKIFESCDVIFAKTTAQPMVAFDVLHMQTQDVFEGFPSSFCGESRITTG
ncbi:hypothetical protein L7F22_043061 [Adiantum nelumboides]|nr:hypothetical protein [Adiantum nelumboides]